MPLATVRQHIKEIESEIKRLRAALNGCVQVLNESAKQHRANDCPAHGKLCDGAAKLTQETLEGK